MLKIKIINDFFFKLKFSIINNIKINIKHVLDIPDDLGESLPKKMSASFFKPPYKFCSPAINNP